ncbi:MAG TPA: hypothetical protein VNZ26_04280, partial [Vicinamibacterales bacterium]|nr:hypothetical protein [Vicinamibacterales bacterium]
GSLTAEVADMPVAGRMLLLLAATPLLMFVGHAVTYRALDRAGRRPSAHSSAFVALAAVLVPVSVAVLWLGGSLCGLAYVVVGFGAMGILYIDVVNIAETSLHMHLLLELAWTGGAPVSDMLERYSPDRMIATRLERLTSIGQVRMTDGRCYIANRSTLRFAKVIDAWRVVLGLPTTPADIKQTGAGGAGRAGGAGGAGRAPREN